MPNVEAEDGVSLYHERRGTGDPLVLVPGLGGDGRFWAGVAQILETRFDVVIVDHRGAGRSDRPDGPYSIGRIAQDVLRVLDAEGLAAAHIVGHSTGGAITQTLALDAPARVRSIVVSGSWDRPDARFRMLFEARAALLEAGEAGLYQALTHVLGYTAEWLEAHEAELDAAAADPRALAPVAVTAARVRMLLDFDRSSELGTIKVPALVIGAVDDLLIPVGHARRLASLIPGATFVRLSGGHFHPRTDPGPFAAAVATFLASPAGSTGG